MDQQSHALYALPPGIQAQEGSFVKCASDDFHALVFQDTRVFKAGNSLAIRIPSGIAKRIGLEDGAGVEMSVSNGMIYVRRAPSQELTKLIAQITPENVHQPTFDNVIGSEAW